MAAYFHIVILLHIIYFIVKYLYPILSAYSSIRLVFDSRRLGGNRFTEGNGWPLDDIIGTNVSAIPALDAEGIGGIDAGGMVSGTDFALAITARPRSLGRSLLFHVRTFPEPMSSTVVSSRARLGSRCVGGKTPHSNCMKGICCRAGKQCVNCA